MKKLCVFLAIIAGSTLYSQHIPSELSLAVKESSIFDKQDLSTPDFSFYSTNYQEIFRDYEYTFNMLDTSKNRVYVDGDKFYSGTYIPVLLQVQYQGSGINSNYYYNDKDYIKGLFVDVPKILSK
jgi:hypothetical protein